MAWYPKAIRREITKHRTPMAAYRRFILHTAVSSASSLFDWHMKVSHCSHFYVRADGVWEQYVDTRFRAPNQFEGNSDSVSIESQDMGGPFPRWSGSNVPAWTGRQAEAIAELAVWLNEVHGIPLVRLPSSRPGTRGIGWHRQGIDGNFPDPPSILAGRVSGGETWSDPGKVCPGDRRIQQIPGIIARAVQIMEGDMPLTDEDINRVAKAVWERSLSVPDWMEQKWPRSWPDGTFSAGGVHGSSYGHARSANERTATELAALRGQMSGLTALVQQLATMPPVPLTGEQLAELTTAVTQAAAGAAEQALENTRLVVGEG